MLDEKAALSAIQRKVGMSKELRAYNLERIYRTYCNKMFDKELAYNIFYEIFYGVDGAYKQRAKCS